MSVMVRVDDEVLAALKNLRQEVAELFESGMWKKSPGGDQYTYEGPTSKVDEVRDALGTAEMEMVQKGVDP